MVITSKDPQPMPASRVPSDISKIFRSEQSNLGFSYVSAATIVVDKMITCEEIIAALDALALELNAHRSSPTDNDGSSQE